MFMKKNLLVPVCLLIGFCTVFFVYSCSKDDETTTTPTDPCAGKTITVTPTVSIKADPCANNSGGKVTVSATGSTNFSYKVDNGAYQASSEFTNLTAGSHSFTVKDGAGCEKSASVDVPLSTAGPKFALVKALVTSRCSSPNCHGGARSPDFRQDCNIVASADRIKVRSVDIGDMPPGGALAQADKDKITSWVTAGKKFTD
jgi:hypothetical protein